MLGTSSIVHDEIWNDPSGCLSPSWFALKVNARSELIATRILDAKGYETYCPTISERRRYCDRYKTVDVPVFPGYLLIRWDGGNKVPILTCPGVSYLVSFDGEPATIPTNVVNSLRKMLGGGAKPVPYLRVGEMVRVESGSLSGVEGIYLRRAARGQLVVSIEIVERSVALCVDESQVMPLAYRKR